MWEEGDEEKKLMLDLVVLGRNDPMAFHSSNYNHSGNFKQHLLKHERESASISAVLVAKAKEIGVDNLLDVNIVLTPPSSNHGSKMSPTDGDPRRQVYECDQCGSKKSFS